jgi:hypothetical protein
MIAIEDNVGGLKLGPQQTQTNIDEGLTARVLWSIWHAFRDGAAMYAASYWAAPDPGIGRPPRSH